MEKQRAALLLGTFAVVYKDIYIHIYTYYMMRRPPLRNTSFSLCLCIQQRCWRVGDTVINQQGMMDLHQCIHFSKIGTLGGDEVCRG